MCVHVCTLTYVCTDVHVHVGEGLWRGGPVTLVCVCACVCMDAYKSVCVCVCVSACLWM